MLAIKRIRIEIQTNRGLFGFDEIFKEKVQLIWSRGNTVGKSSILSAIFYGLGMEELIGGKGSTVLSSVFKKKLKFNDEDLQVLESKIFLEISNGIETNTILRTIVNESRTDSLATVFNTEYHLIYDPQTTATDYYVHGPKSATNNYGFFSYLEKFLGITLPMVPNRSGSESKLYLQLLFSGMLIEQKRGWADFFSAMPHFGIVDAKKRVVEYILNLDSLENEKRKKETLYEERTLKTNWKTLHREISNELNQYNIHLNGISGEIEIMNHKEPVELIIVKDDSPYALQKYITLLKEKYRSLEQLVKNDAPHIELLQEKLDSTLSNIQTLEKNISDAQALLNIENDNLSQLNQRLLLMDNDINNNQDALKLKKIGSTKNFDLFKDTCPTCKQKIADSVLTIQNSNLVMAIEENISHLTAQKKVVTHSLGQIEKNIEKITIKINQVKQAKNNLTNLARIIKNDIYSLNGSYSEESVFEKVRLFNEIEKYIEISEKYSDIETKFRSLSEKWKANREAKETLPKDNLSPKDKLKLNKLNTFFKSNLKKFDFSSTTDFFNITISEETFLPSIDGFDLKFDSSASDYIRGIWSFTIALLQTSIEVEGNHFGLIIFDEPGQHNIIKKDVTQLFDVLKSIEGYSQTFIGITTESIEITDIIKQNSFNNIEAIEIDTKSFKPF